MKVRSDFVTNSSSSSFVLAFNKSKDYYDFLDGCEQDDYEQLALLVQDSIDLKPEDERVKEAIEYINAYYRFVNYDEVLLQNKFGDRWDYSDWREIASYRNSEEYDNLLQELFNNDCGYKTAINTIENSEIVVAETIWDTSGGLLNWAIRNGFLESCFRRYLVVRWNVG